MVYVDPLKLEAHQLSVMDVVRTVNEANLILPAGDVKIGPYDYNLYVNSQINDMKDINQVPLKTSGNASVLRRRCRPRGGRFGNPIQRRARGRPAVGLSARDETGR
jgi:multidrug efflux pump subunit AcrB